MCSTNLAVCIGPSLINSPTTFSTLERDVSFFLYLFDRLLTLLLYLQEVSTTVPKLISFLIDHTPDLFGEQVLTLLGSELETRPRPDSGTDSMNSLQDVSSISLNNITSSSDNKDVRNMIINSSSSSGTKSTSSSSEESEETTPSNSSSSSPPLLRLRSPPNNNTSSSSPTVEYYPSNVVLHCMCYACQTTRGRERELRRITWSPWSSLDTLV